MLSSVNRRGFLVSAGVTAGSLALPTRAFAQPFTATPGERQILQIARREVDRNAAILWRHDIAGIVDFAQHSSVRRFHFANLVDGTVRSVRVTHGAGSDPEHDGYLKWFSNVPGSLATSRGAYVTWEWYTGQFGFSVRLGGLDEDNVNTYDRAIVMHAADYATQAHLDRWGRLGRSNGCFAFAPDDLQYAFTQLLGGRLIYADRLNLA